MPRFPTGRRRYATRLKSLELYGFKSFADRARLDFGDGITAFVGPNGSGKSNVVDALRWVFGEQNPRSLRGQRWEEVIFAGSATRRPLSLAEVTATLDNGDGRLDLPWTEIEVSRRVLRSGESEYVVNRVPCRLKDVLDLAERIGAAGGAWSYIAQAGVDEVLNSRPEDRRAVLEETAGLARFQARRQEVRRRLEETDAAAQRLRDLVIELEGQLKPLEGEAELAERFLGLRRELEDVDAAVWADAAARLERRREAAARRRETLRESLSQLEADAAETRERLAACRAQVATARQHCEQAATRERQAALAESQARSAYAVLEERTAAGSSALESAAQRAARLASRVNPLDLALSAAREAAAAADALPSGPAAARLSPEPAAAEGALAEAARTRAERLASERELRARLSAAEGERSAVAQTVSGIELRLADLSKRGGVLEADLVAVQARRSASEGAMGAAEERERVAAAGLERLRAEFSADRLALERLSATAAGLRESQARLAGERTVLDERLSAYSNLSPGTPLAAALTVKTAAAASGIPASGPLGELVEVDQGYERAAQTALGAAACALAVRDIDTALRLFALRTPGEGGPLAVLPDTTGPGALPGGRREGGRLPEGVDSLLDHVRSTAPDELSPAVLARLLGGWAVASHLEEAISLWRSHPGVCAVVTAGGEAFTPEGLILDGTSWAAGRVLEERRERDRLRERLAEIASQSGATSADLERLDAEVSRLLKRQRALQGEIEAVDRSRAAASAENRRLAEARARETARHEDLLSERARILGESAGLADRLALARQDAGVRARTCDELRARLEQASRMLQEAETRLDDQRNKVHELRLAVARASDEAKARAVQVQRLEEQRRALAEDLKAAGEEEAASKAALAGLRTKRSEAEAVLRALEAGRRDAERLSAAAAAGLRASEEAASQLESHLGEAVTRREGALRSLGGLEVLVTRLEGEARSLGVARGALAERFRDLAPRLEADREGLHSRRAQLGDLLAALGQVNLGAAEQCRRLRERLAYLGRQEEDLRSSREVLSLAAGELDGETARRFLEAFEECRNRFRRVFAELFAGGQADLTLTDPDNPLSSGVEIYAQPPGKRLSGLALLSGGERALTAVALLFALVGGSTSGFCVLDEVDAYLDDPNCARFCRYLRNLSSNRQFLVITHNKATMEAAATLYGLTMEEEGVSRVVSVRLDQAAAAGGQG